MTLWFKRGGVLGDWLKKGRYSGRLINTWWFPEDGFGM
jgi:hypothetical protein